MRTIAEPRNYVVVFHVSWHMTRDLFLVEG